LLLGPLSGPSARIDGIASAGRREHDQVANVERLGTSISTRFEMPEDFAAYLELIGSRQRGNHSRSEKQFAKNHQVVADTVSDPDEVLREFDSFRAIHEEQWAAEGKLGHFGDWPKAADFNRDLVDCLGRLGMVRFFRILADGEVACSQFCFRFRETNYWRLPGRACRPGWEKLSLGKMGLIRMIEASIAEGLSVVEGGRGHYDYKVQLGGVEWPLRTIEITRRGFGVRFRVRSFLACARMLNLLYYKVFFLRLAPKFPLLRRSLWSVWIRSTW
jgi:CelD/BcsL family acetyltransferase involved in cellulose biosynthesis